MISAPTLYDDEVAWPDYRYQRFGGGNHVVDIRSFVLMNRRGDGDDEGIGRRRLRLCLEMELNSGITEELFEVFLLFDLARAVIDFAHHVGIHVHGGDGNTGARQMQRDREAYVAGSNDGNLFEGL
jgi:hypothetical protein